MVLFSFSCTTETGKVSFGGYHPRWFQVNIPTTKQKNSKRSCIHWFILGIIPSF